MKPETLERIGMTPGESRIYLALLDLGQSTTGPIVERSGVSTSKTYKILKRLERKGLVSHIIKKNVMHWAAASPKRIVEMLEEKEKEIEERREEAENLIPELMKKIESAREKQQAEVYMGMKGMITVFNDETDYLKKKNAVNHVIGVTSPIRYGKKIHDFFVRLENKKDNLKLKRRFLFSEEARGKWPTIERSKYCKVRYMNYASLVSVNIYGETAFISILSKEPIFFIIKSREIAESFKGYFEELWKGAKD
ncbi:hypothetical protein GF345_04215 [Candidatus Woesearchaeota archaeon]|nr:hypothetical protein [Candidatus Woesearchaeota archaeon]